MDLGTELRAVIEPDQGQPFPLPPPAGAIRLPQARRLADRCADGDGLDVRDIADHLEVHEPSIVPQSGTVDDARRPVRRVVRCADAEATGVQAPDSAFAPN